MSERNALIFGASGLIGEQCVRRFVSDQWKVTAVSRRAPAYLGELGVAHIPLDLWDKSSCERALRMIERVDEVVYCAVYEKEGLIQGWQDEDQMQRNLEMLENALTPILRFSAVKHITLLQGTKAYGIHIHPIRIPAREREPRDNHKNFYWLQEDWLKSKAQYYGFGWNIFRPTVVLGDNVGVAMSIIPIIGIFGTLCREEGRRFGFPGHIAYPREAVDARLIGEAICWAAKQETAWNEHFNITNGEVFSWRDLWPSISELLGLPVAKDSPLSLAEFLPKKEQEWEVIKNKYGLQDLKLKELLGQSHYYADFGFGYGFKKMPEPGFVSRVKLSTSGFTKVMDTEKAVHYWLKELMRKRVIPYPND